MLVTSTTSRLIGVSTILDKRANQVVYEFPSTVEVGQDAKYQKYPQYYGYDKFLIIWIFFRHHKARRGEGGKGLAGISSNNIFDYSYYKM